MNQKLLLLLPLAGIFAHAAEPAKVPASVGLVNDWLRGESDAAKAWDLGGQFRVRYEVHENGGLIPNRDFLEGLDNSNDFFLFRSKVHLGWNPYPWISVFVEGRDSHDASDHRPQSEVDAFDLYQAYVRLGDPKKFPITAKIGRQEMLYGDERYIGISDWSNTGRAFDAAKLRFENDYLWVDAFSGRIVLNRDENFNVVNDYDWFSGIYAHTEKLLPFQETELYFLSRNVGANSPTAITPTLGGPSSRDIYTIGTRFKSLPNQFGAWDYVFEGAGQFGGIGRGAARLEHQAFAINGTGGYTFRDTFGAPRVTVGYDFGTGDSNPTDSKNETFELLFGTNHRPYGQMDLFSMRNMHIPRAGASIKPAKDLTVSADALVFYLADTSDFLFPESGAGRSGNGYGRNPGFASYVGTEVEIYFQWKFTGWGQLQGGYGHFFTGEYIRQSAAAGGFQSEDADWLYAQLVFNF